MLAEIEPSLHGRRTGDVTASITSAVRDWAQANGWSSLTEVPVVMPNDPTNMSRRQGLYDIVIERSGLPDLVIEIDRANKRWSAKKLGFAADRGMEAVWVRWSGRPPTPDLVPDGVVVIRISVRAVRQTSEHPRGKLRGRRRDPLDGPQETERRGGREVKS